MELLLSPPLPGGLLQDGGDKGVSIKTPEQLTELAPGT